MEHYEIAGSLSEYERRMYERQYRQMGIQTGLNTYQIGITTDLNGAGMASVRQEEPKPNKILLLEDLK